MLYLDKLKALKAEKGLTNVEIAQLSNIPLATITRIFNGQTPNPTFETFSQIALALGLSLDEITGFKPADAQPTSSPIEKTLDAYASLLKEKDIRINELKTEKEALRKDKLRLGIGLACIIAFILIIFTIDILNGHFGYIRY